MTTICLRDGIIASDSQVCQGSRICGNYQKIYEYQDCIIGVAGTLAAISQFLEWHSGDKLIVPDCNRLSENYRGFDALVFNKKTHEVIQYNDSFYPEIIDADFYAIGSGAELAIGAMAMGATADKAIRVACQFDKNSGGNIITVHLW